LSKTVHQSRKSNAKPLALSNAETRGGNTKEPTATTAAEASYFYITPVMAINPALKKNFNGAMEPQGVVVREKKTDG
jgi:hypothetical protein